MGNGTDAIEVYPMAQQDVDLYLRGRNEVPLHLGADGNLDSEVEQESSKSKLEGRVAPAEGTCAKTGRGASRAG